MKASEFVKKFGWGAAKNILHGMDDASEFTAHMPGDAWDKPTLVDAVCLRRLIESNELVEQYNGLFEAKELIRVSPKMTSELRELAAAIEDVESCQ